MRSRFWVAIILAITVGVAATTTACGINFNASTPVCKEYIPPAQPAPASSPEETKQPKTITPTKVCDDWITIRGSEAECAFLDRSYELNIGGKDRNGEPIKVSTKIGEYVQIEWGSSIPHAIIVNGDIWGYVNGPGSEGEGRPAPSAIILR